MLDLSKGTGAQYQVIVTPKIRNILMKTFQFGEILAGHPYTWNKSKQRAELGSLMQGLIWSVNMTLANIHVAFVLIRVIQGTLDEELSLGDKIQLKFISAYYLLAAFIHGIIIRNKFDFIYYINQCLDVVEKFEKDFLISDSDLPKPMEAVGTIMQWVWVILATMHGSVVIISLTRPYSFEQVSSLLANKGEVSSPLTALPSGIITVYVIYLLITSATTTVMVGFCTLLLNVFVLGELSPAKCSVTGMHLRQPENVLRVYGKVRLLINLCNQIYGQVLFPTKLQLPSNPIHVSGGIANSKFGSEGLLQETSPAVFREMVS
ncbi:unnamed protein product [Allacma fusca]|uniref:Uncharacterized protein n=1 Tax=Allacma fusca TaxID=39272 RepID=A0A8J2KHW0_9HEXA|nr:unnamed protein product [Allacma fusca]